jgi:hypothetical protein
MYEKEKKKRYKYKEEKYINKSDNRKKRNKIKTKDIFK